MSRTPYNSHQPLLPAVTRWGRRFIAVLASVGMVLGVTAVVGPSGVVIPTAAAETRSEDGDNQPKWWQWDPLDQKPPTPIRVKSPENTKPLAPDNSANGRCERDPLASNFQRCEIYSHAMKRNIPIHYKPAARGGHSALLLLDGASARDEFNRWIPRGLAPSTMKNTDMAIIAPIGGGASWYVDWQYPNCSPAHPEANPQMWETFITKELRAWGTRRGINPSLYSVAGFSMGGASALMLSGRNHDMFKQALSFSGTNTLVVPGVQPLLNFTEDWGPCMLSPFGSMLNPTRYQMDPTLNVEKLRGIDVYASSANGLPRKGADLNQLRRDLENGYWETGTFILLKMFEAAAKRKNVPVTVNYLGRGSHQYEDAARELINTRKRILKVMKREERKLGKAADPASKAWKLREQKRKKAVATMKKNAIDAREARKRYDELRKNEVFREGMEELEEEYGRDVVLCLIQHERLAWTRSIPAQPVVSEEAIRYCQANPR
ncbi:MAG: alpha/beta hydrolase family protein [Lawsonella sp.]